MDEERAREVARVLDEGPPAGLSDRDSEDHHHGWPYHGHIEQDSNGYGNGSGHHGAMYEEEYDRSSTPTAHYALSPSTTVVGNSTPTLNSRQASDSPPGQAQVFPSSSSKSQQQPQQTPSTNGKRRATKTSTTTARDRSKATAQNIAAKKREEEERKRRALGHGNEDSIAAYPTPGDEEDMADAIPVWTQPVARSGNWDEVVLPAVARKKGLEGYELQGGGSQPKLVERIIAPAPGTFGYDHTKYRPPRQGESYPMDEFGRDKQGQDALAEESFQYPEQQQPSPQQNGWGQQYQPPPQPQPPRFVGQQPPPQQVPFSDYTPGPQDGQKPVLEQKPVEEEDVKGGCCAKCVIM